MARTPAPKMAGMNPPMTKAETNSAANFSIRALIIMRNSPNVSRQYRECQNF